VKCSEKVLHHGRDGLAVGGAIPGHPRSKKCYGGDGSELYLGRGGRALPLEGDWGMGWIEVGRRNRRVWTWGGG